jgi:hypothetical protein
MNEKIKGLVYKYFNTRKTEFESLAYGVDDLLQECLLVEWQTKNKDRILHNCKQRLQKILRQASTVKRRHEEISLSSILPNELYEQNGVTVYRPIKKIPHKAYLELNHEERKESWIYPGIGSENLFGIFKTGNLNANARFEYEGYDLSERTRETESGYRLYIEPNAMIEPWLYSEKPSLSLIVESAVGRYLGWPM